MANPGWVPKQANLRVMNALGEAGLDIEIIRHDHEARTAEQAAALLGCDLAQIAKSLVFSAGDGLVMTLVSGANRADTNKLATLLGQPVSMANAERVKTATGYAIGGVAPVGHPTPLPIYLDEDLLKYETIYPAAGTPNTAFAINSRVLQRISGAIVADIKELLYPLSQLKERVIISPLPAGGEGQGEGNQTMQTKLDKQLAKRTKERRKEEEKRLKQGPKVYDAEKRTKVQQSSGRSGAKELGMFAPLALVRILAALISELKRYGTWPYVILGWVGLREYQRVQEHNARLKRREEWEKAVK